MANATVWRSGAFIDAAEIGQYMGDPHQSFSPSRIETFPTAERVLGGFGYDQSSWVFTQNDFAVLSELTGEVMWDGPRNVGIAGPHAFSRGWKNLPFWVSHDKQLYTMHEGEAIPISSEYEAALLQRIADSALVNTEVLYFRDPTRLIDALRIKGLDKNNKAFTIIHDFNLRDDRSPFGQGYEEWFVGQLSTDYTHEVIRDKDGRLRVWAGSSDDNLYQLYTGGNDDGNEFTADGVALIYVGPDRTALEYIDYYGDENVEWYVSDQLNCMPDPLQMDDLTANVEAVQGQETDSHYQVSLNRPEMIHGFVWMRLQSHSQDAATRIIHPATNQTEDTEYSVVVHGQTVPWLNSPNPDYFIAMTAEYSPESLSVAEGDSVDIAYSYGLVLYRDGEFYGPARDSTGNQDANAAFSDSTQMPSDYVAGNYLHKLGSGFPDSECLICAWADDNGSLVAPPFAPGIWAQVTAPAGATQLLFGVNDKGATASPNQGSWIMDVIVSHVTVGQGTVEIVPSLDPMVFNDPPHMPLETYGRIYLIAPLLGTSAGR